MSTILVVDDSPLDRRLAGTFLEQEHVTVAFAADGQDALAFLNSCTADIVLTDLQMPKLDGLQLVEEIRRHHPTIPVVLMTAHGSEEIAVEALRKGAASYVPKRLLAQNLATTVMDVLAMARADRNQKQLIECMTASETSFVLDNTPALVPQLAGHLQDSMQTMKLCDETGLIRVGMALSEALDNAMYHGNLGIRSGSPENLARLEVAAKRRNLAPYRDRQVHVTARLSREEAVFVIRDDGEGFNPANLPDPTDPANLGDLTGRGVLLMRTFMDEVHYNSTGNVVTMVKRQEL